MSWLEHIRGFTGGSRPDHQLNVFPSNKRHIQDRATITQVIFDVEEEMSWW